MSDFDRVPEEIAALISAHALGALEHDEAAEVERWLASSDACRRLFAEALETAAWLAVATTEATPPSDLRARILAAARQRGDADAR